MQLQYKLLTVCACFLVTYSAFYLWGFPAAETMIINWLLISGYIITVLAVLANEKRHETRTRLRNEPAT